MKRRVGVIGLGRMGMPIAGHLVRAGHSVYGHDVQPDAQDQARELGVSVCASPAEAAAKSDATFVIVGHGDQVVEVCLDEETGIVAGASSGHAVFIASTVAPELAVQLAGRLLPMGIEVLDATLSRSHHAAIEGSLLVLTGGHGGIAEDWRNVMESFASDILHVGDIGAGQLAKTINNLLLWIAVSGNREAMQLGMRHGLDQAALRAAVLAGSGGNWGLETWERARPMPWAEDDLEIALEAAKAVGLEMSMTEQAAETIAAIKKDKAALDLGDASMHTFLESTEGPTDRNR